MKAKTLPLPVETRQRINQRVKTFFTDKSRPIQILSTMAAGFLMANSYILKGLAPFGVAFTAASQPSLALAAAAGSLLGYIFSFGVQGSLRYIAALLLVYSIRFSLSVFPRLKNSLLLSIGLTFVCISGTSLAISGMYGYLSGYDVAAALSEGVLAAGSAFFFARSIAAFVHYKNIYTMNSSDRACVIITLGIAVVALNGVALAGLSLGRILSIAIILLCAHNGKEAAGAIAGIVTGAAMSLVAGGEGLYFLAVTYSLGGLLAGMFSVFGKIGVASVFAVVNCLGAALSSAGGPTGGMYAAGTLTAQLYETVAAVAVFFILPASAGKMLVQFGNMDSGAADAATVKDVLLSRLHYASSALKDISSTTHQVSDKLNRLEGEPNQPIYTRACDKVCKSCRRNPSCWQLQYDDTLSALERAGAAVKQKGSVCAADLPADFTGRCVKLQPLLDNINIASTDLLNRRSARQQVSQVRSVVTDQFEGMSILLEEMAQCMGEIVDTDAKLTQRLRAYLERISLGVISVGSFQDRFGKTTIEMVIPAYKLSRLDKAELTQQLSDLSQLNLAQPVVKNQGEDLLLLFTEKADYGVRFGAAQLSAEDGPLCGDSYGWITAENGKAYLLLSDGMGSGSKAAVDSAMTVGLLTRLLSAGFAYDAALKMVNSALLVKSGEESLATVDITAIDLYTGKAEFLKAGAAPTFIRKGCRVGRVETMSLPAGILGGVSFEKSHITLKDQDIIVMLSDGVIASGIDWLPSEINAAVDAFYKESADEGGEMDPQKLAQRILDTAKNRRTDGHQDDMTVTVALLERAF